MFDLVDMVLAFVAGIAVTVMYVYWMAQRWLRRVRRLIEDAIKEDATAEEDNNFDEKVNNGKIVLLEVEVDHNQFFCYNSKTRQFVCQGTNVAEIIEHFKQRFPGLNAVLHTGDEQALTTLRQQLKEHRENSSSIRSSS